MVVAFDWSSITENWRELAEGLLRTIEVSAIAIAGAFVIGAVLGAARAHRVPVVSQLAGVYVEVIRNTPNFRAGFEAVPYRYREAGLALGLSRMRTFLNVTLPIGGRIALPSSINTYISVLKNTSLLYVISYPELTTTAFHINNLTLQTVESFTVLAVIYLALVWTLSASIRRVESHLRIPEER